MTKVLTLSDELVARLQRTAQQRGYATVEEYLMTLLERGEDEAPRRAAVERVHELRARMLAKYGYFPDSADSIREDRDR